MVVLETWGFSCLTISYINSLYTAQIREAVLNGVSLEDEKREHFNKIEQVCS